MDWQDYRLDRPLRGCTGVDERGLEMDEDPPEDDEGEAPWEASNRLMSEMGWWDLIDRFELITEFE